jgi:phosphatidate cytidylyltransferase
VIWQFALAGFERAPVSRTNIMASILAATYLPFMAGFVILIMGQHQHAPYWRVALLILLCVANDTGGYFAGIFLGKHPMAPSVSPKKSWEGFAGSILLTCLVGILGSHWVLGLPFIPNLSVAANPAYPGPVWLSVFGSAIGLGLLLGFIGAIVSTIGDLSESLIKRDLGIKDMGSILPGHGGVLDRIDSAIFAAPFIF